jgi:hypothetical protein
MANTTSPAKEKSADIISTVIGLEKAALEKWYKGDPSGFIDISADDVVYFDPFTEQRLDGLETLTKYLEVIRGEVNVSRYEKPNPNVQVTSEMAVLTFNLFSYSGDKIAKWNCTEVYRLERTGQWKIIQTHWSFIKPDLK